MKRLADYYLQEWKNSPYRKPLLLRGARQVGKTYLARTFGKQFDNFVEINFESDKEVHSIFSKDLNPERIIRDLSLIVNKPIIPSKTLLFFDEIQTIPEALTALRYFYEKLPEQHIIAAGSLLDFTTQLVGIPVGRVASLYVYPLSFFEFLCACKHTLLAQELLTNIIENPISSPVHKKLLSLLGEYLAIGGMPEAVARWRETRDPRPCIEVHQALIDTYRQDFNKYAQKFQIKYLEILFNAIPRQLGTKFKYSAIEGEYRKRELSPCIDLLTTAGIVHKVIRSAGNGIPLGAEVDPDDFKINFLDVGLTQTILGQQLKSWFLDPEQTFINKGAVVESFVGQEFLAYTSAFRKEGLFYWRRNTPGSEAEIDYLINHNNKVVPIEVKSGTGSSLKSMQMFLESHHTSPHGIRFSTQNYSVYNAIHSYPLYALAYFMLQDQKDQLPAYHALMQ